MQEQLLAIRKPNSGTSMPPVSGVQQGFNFGQDRQTNVPPGFNMGSVKLVQQERPSLFTMAITEGQPTWPPPPELVVYDIAMKKITGETSVKERNNSVRFDERSIGEASQPTISDTTISVAEEAAICIEVREIMQKKIATSRATMGTNPGSHHEDFCKILCSNSFCFSN